MKQKKNFCEKAHQRKATPPWFMSKVSHSLFVCVSVCFLWSFITFEQSLLFIGNSWRLPFLCIFALSSLPFVMFFLFGVSRIPHRKQDTTCSIVAVDTRYSVSMLFFSTFLFSPKNHLSRLIKSRILQTSRYYDPRMCQGVLRHCTQCLRLLHYDRSNGAE